MVESNSNRFRSPSVFKTVQGPAPITLHDWRTARDSNPEPLVLETRTLPIELAIHVWWSGRYLKSHIHPYEGCPLPLKVPDLNL